MYQKLPEYLIVMNTRLEQQLDVGQPSGLVGLWEESGRGAKAKWTNEDIEYIENCLHQEQRTYNSTQLVRKLKQERAVNLSSDRLRRILKKKALLNE